MTKFYSVFKELKERRTLETDKLFPKKEENLFFKI